MKLKQAVLEITYECDSKCIFCYNVWHNGAEKGNELSLSGYRTILDKLPNTELITISGGEPLKRKDIFDIIDLAHEYTKKVTVLSSGLLIDDKIAAKIAKSGVRIQIPVHGLQQTHDELTGKKGNYKTVLKNLLRLRNAGALYSTATVVNKKNLKELKRLFDVCVGMGSTYLFIIRFLPGGRGLKHGELQLTKNELVEVYGILDYSCKEYGISGGLGIPNLPCVIDPSKYKHIDFTYCSAGIDWITIDPSGRVRMCNHSPTIIGDLNTTSFEEIWNSDFLRKFRNGCFIPEKCKDCKWVCECRGGCRAGAETAFGDIRELDPLMASSLTRCHSR
jgi:radical SAM protein with 4Fe4S-binding SPASM domain